MNETEAVRATIGGRIEAMKRRDASAAVAMLDPLIVAFEVAGPPQVTSEQARDVTATQAWLNSFLTGPRIEVSELKIFADGGVAFCHSLHRLSGTMNDGRKIDVVLRSTLGLRKVDDEWLIIHAHTSVPR